MTPALLCERLGAHLNGIEQALAEIRRSGPAAAGLPALRAELIDLLALLARDPGLDAAADDLHRSARALAEAACGTEAARRERTLGEARERFLRHLEAAGFELVPAAHG